MSKTAIALILIPTIVMVVMVFAAISTLYPCMGIYCGADGTSFYTLDYSVVEAYNATLK
jgi:hypothetical protein